MPDLLTPSVQTDQRLLTFGELLSALAERMPGGRKPNHRWLRQMREAIPYVPVPGARRRYYLLEPVWQYLCSLVVYPAPKTSAEVVHRRRGRPPKSGRTLGLTG